MKVQTAGDRCAWKLETGNGGGWGEGGIPRHQNWLQLAQACWTEWHEETQKCSQALQKHPAASAQHNGCVRDAHA